MITAESLRTRPAFAAPATGAAAAWLAPAAAGVFAGAALFDMLPAAADAVGTGFLWWSAAGLAATLAAIVLVKHPDRRWIGWAAGAGIWLHSLLEGLAAGTGFASSMGAGLLMSVGLMVHLVPESLALYGLVVSTGGSSRRALACCAVPWALVLAGFAGSRYLAASLAHAPMGRAMAFGGGVLLCLAFLSWGESSGSRLRASAIAAGGLLLVAAQHLGG